MANMARLHTYIRPLKLAYVDAVRGGGVHSIALWAEAELHLLQLSLAGVDHKQTLPNV